MKKKILCFLLVLTTTLTMSMATAFADTEPADATNDTEVTETAEPTEDVEATESTADADTEVTEPADDTEYAEDGEVTGPLLYNVTDDAYILSEDELYKLEVEAEAVTEKYGVGVYIVTVDNYLNYYDCADAYEATYSIYHDYNMGEGEGRDGIMLLLSLGDRSYGLFSYGQKSEYAFDDYGLDMLEDEFLDNFGDDDWYGGFSDYISECSSYLEQAEAGDPVRESPAFFIVLIIAFAIFAAFLSVANLWIRMGQVAKMSTADNYIAGELNVTEKKDTFAYQTQVRHKIKSSSSSGSSSRSHSGGGGHGRSGHF